MHVHHMQQPSPAEVNLGIQDRSFPLLVDRPVVCPGFSGGELLDSCATQAGRRVAWDGAGIRRSFDAGSWIWSRRVGRSPTSPGIWGAATSRSTPGGAKTASTVPGTGAEQRREGRTGRASAASPSWRPSFARCAVRSGWCERWCPQREVRGGRSDGRRRHPGAGGLPGPGRVGVGLLRLAVPPAVGAGDPPRLARPTSSSRCTRTLAAPTGPAGCTRSYGLAAGSWSATARWSC
jgi:hypothetical protein